MSNPDAIIREEEQENIMNLLQMNRKNHRGDFADCIYHVYSKQITKLFSDFLKITAKIFNLSKTFSIRLY